MTGLWIADQAGLVGRDRKRKGVRPMDIRRLSIMGLFGKSSSVAPSNEYEYYSKLTSKSRIKIGMFLYRSPVLPCFTGFMNAK